MHDRWRQPRRGIRPDQTLRIMALTCGLTRRRRQLAVGLAILLTVALLINREFLLRFRSYWLDPQPVLLPGQGAEIVAAFPRLPAGAPLQPPLPITRRIHFMYKCNMVDNAAKSYLQSWRRVYPQYEIFFWTDKEINELVAARYPDWQHLYHKQLSVPLERSDVARAFILHTLGGWYSDIDGWALRSAEPVVRERGLVLPLEPYLHAMQNFNKYQLASNAIMYSAPGHPFWLFYLQHIRQGLVSVKPRTDSFGAAFLTGPVPLTEAAMLFNQAHSQSGCPFDPWCPYLPPPLLFMPAYDSVAHRRNTLRFFCFFTFRHPEFLKDCEHYKKFDYENHVDPSQSFTFHKFIHMNERKPGQDRRNVSDVRSWGLGLLTGPKILAALGADKSGNGGAKS